MASKHRKHVVIIYVAAIIAAIAALVLLHFFRSGSLTNAKEIDSLQKARLSVVDGNAVMSSADSLKRLITKTGEALKDPHVSEENAANLCEAVNKKIVSFKSMMCNAADTKDNELRIYYLHGYNVKQVARSLMDFQLDMISHIANNRARELYCRAGFYDSRGKEFMANFSPKTSSDKKCIYSILEEDQKTIPGQDNTR